MRNLLIRLLGGIPKPVEVVYINEKGASSVPFGDVQTKVEIDRLRHRINSLDADLDARIMSVVLRAKKKSATRPPFATGTRPTT